MNRIQKRRLCWLPALVLSCVLMLVAFSCLNARYETNDDNSIMRSMMGAEGGVFSSFQPEQGGLVTVPLSWLSAWKPDIAWFSLFQLSALALGFAVILKSLLQKSLKARHGWIAGTVLCAVFAFGMGLYVFARVTFTTTAAVLLAASIMQLLSVDTEEGSKGEIIRGCIPAGLYLLLSYELRLEILPLALCLFVLIAAWKLLHRYHRAVLLCALCSVVVLLCACGARAWRVRQSDVADYVEWHNTRSALMDYYSFEDITDEVLEKAGWDKATLQLVSRWCFLPEESTTESMKMLLEYCRSLPTQTMQSRLRNAIPEAARACLGLKTKLSSTNNVNLYSMRLMTLLCAMSLIFVLLQKENRKKSLLLWGVLTALCFAMICYLAYHGRMPFRAMYCVALPISSVFLWLLLPQGETERLWLWALPAAAAGVFAVLLTLSALQNLKVNAQLALEVGDPEVYLDEYAADNEDKLIIYDYSLSGIATDLFPKLFGERLPRNLTFWGGWRMFSPESVTQFRDYGIDLINRSAEDWLSDNIYFATGICDPLLPQLTEYLRSRVDPSLEPVIVSEDGGIYYVQFW